MRAALPFAVGLGALAISAVLPPGGRSSSSASTPPTVTVAAAGDIACAPTDSGYNHGRGTASACQMRATARLLTRNRLDAVLPLGDLQYERGELAHFRSSYGPTWGRVKSVTRPAPGNHEYATPGAAGYYTYFGRAAGKPSRGYYSFALGAWRLIALNSNCPQVPGGCDVGSPQEQWLRAVLKRHRNRCVLAYSHHPRFSSGVHGDHPQMAALFAALYDARADVVLAGHDHTYERFAPQSPAARLERRRGIRVFVVGTGGRSLYGFGQIKPNSRARANTSFGVLLMTLRPRGYSWRFVTAAGSPFKDAGSTTCA